MFDAPDDKLAQIIVERGEITLYFHGVAKVHKINMIALERLVVSLRDPAGPAIWLEVCDETPQVPTDEEIIR